MLTIFNFKLEAGYTKTNIIGYNVISVKKDVKFETHLMSNNLNQFLKKIFKDIKKIKF